MKGQEVLSSFFWLQLGHLEVPGQGLNLFHSSDNARSTHQATRELHDSFLNLHPDSERQGVLYDTSCSLGGYRALESPGLLGSL